MQKIWKISQRLKIRRMGDTMEHFIKDKGDKDKWYDLIEEED